MHASALPAATPTTIDRHVTAVQEVGYTILRQLLDRELIACWRTAFQPLWDATEAAGVAVNRGSARRYLDLPFATPFSDPTILTHPTILAVVRALLGEDAQLLHLGTDTPGPGSTDQDVHSDLPELFPGVDPTPAFAIAVNIPLVDVTRANGPFLAAPGTHRLRFAEGLAAVQADPHRLEPVLLEAGDVLIRDPRMLHKGSANPSGVIRPVAVLAFQRPWLRVGHFAPIALSTTLREALPPALAKILHLHLNRTAV